MICWWKACASARRSPGWRRTGDKCRCSGPPCRAKGSPPRHRAPSGRLGAPVVTARAEVAPLVVNGVTFGGVSGRFAYTREQVSLRDVAVREDHGAVRVTQASLRPERGKPLNGLTLEATVESFPLQR